MMKSPAANPEKWPTTRSELSVFNNNSQSNKLDSNLRLTRSPRYYDAYKLILLVLHLHVHMDCDRSTYLFSIISMAFNCHVWQHPTVTSDQQDPRQSHWQGLKSDRSLTNCAQFNENMETVWNLRSDVLESVNLGDWGLVNKTDDCMIISSPWWKDKWGMISSFIDKRIVELISVRFARVVNSLHFCVAFSTWKWRLQSF